MKKNGHPTTPSVLIKFAHMMGTEIKNGRLDIPKKFGRGYCSGYIFNEHIRMIVLNYELNEDFFVENPDVGDATRMILFKFQNIIPKPEATPAGERPKAMPSVLIGTSRMNAEAVITVDTKTAAINIEVSADYLHGLFGQSEKSPILQSLIDNSQPLLFEQMLYPSLQKIVEEMLIETIDETFTLFFLRIKAEELVCRLLMELVKRDEKHLYALNIQDIKAIYKVKEQMLAHLAIPPVISNLAEVATMSPTKLKRLFRQIFGNSIFSYYQEFRMKEAARLLKEEKLSVSDAGYQLGFKNLSHFSRAFEEHIGMKPKKYSMMQ